VDEQGRVVYVCLISDLKLPHIKLSIAKLSTWAERTPLDPEEQEGNHKLNNIRTSCTKLLRASPAT